MSDTGHLCRKHLSLSISPGFFVQEIHAAANLKSDLICKNKPIVRQILLRIREMIELDFNRHTRKSTASEFFQLRYYVMIGIAIWFPTVEDKSAITRINESFF